MIKFVEISTMASSLLIAFTFIGRLRYKYQIDDALRRNLHPTPIVVRILVFTLFVIALTYGSRSVHYLNDDAIKMSLFEYITRGMGIAILVNILVCLFVSEETCQDQKKQRYDIKYIVIGFMILFVIYIMTTCIDSESLRLEFKKHHEMILNREAIKGACKEGLTPL